MPLAADDLSALADAASGAAAGLPGRRAPGRAHPEPDASGCMTRIPRRRRTTSTSAWACASWSTAQSGSPPRSTCGPRRRPASSAWPPRWRRSRRGRRWTRRAGARAFARRCHMVERVRHRPVDRAHVRQDRTAVGVERTPGRPPRRVTHHRRPAGRVRADISGRPQRDEGDPAPGAPARPARGAGAGGLRGSRRCARWRRRSAGVGST